MILKFFNDKTSFERESDLFDALYKNVKFEDAGNLETENAVRGVERFTDANKRYKVLNKSKVNDEDSIMLHNEYIFDYCIVTEAPVMLMDCVTQESNIRRGDDSSTDGYFRFWTDIGGVFKFMKDICQFLSHLHLKLQMTHGDIVSSVTL